MSYPRYIVDDISVPKEVREELYNRWTDPERTKVRDATRHFRSEERRKQFFIETGYGHLTGYELENYRDNYNHFCELADELRTYLPSDHTNRDAIIAMKLVFSNEYGCVSNTHIKRALGIRHQNVAPFKYIPEEQAVIHKKPPSSSLKKAVRNRDDGCVRCGDSDGKTVHHIIPQYYGGQNVLNNLAILCTECHNDAHPSWRTVEYKRTKEGFWKWANSYTE